jgi:ABC-type glycerol-3-phosphate transport system substrate-binding protein
MTKAMRALLLTLVCAMGLAACSPASSRSSASNHWLRPGTNESNGGSEGGGGMM